ncbi:MAG TPA: NAD(P)/FAD-dependent oxidoreductase [Bradyrhizobium sp.]
MAKDPFRVAIIGAGASGICAAIKLAECGITDFEIFEKAADVGGTWRDNTYPGLTCDIPSHLYRYSFAPNPNWSREYAPGAEIHAYLKGVAKRYGVLEKIHLGNGVKAAAFEQGRWHVTAENGECRTFDAVIAATGILHKAVLPEIEGRDQFAGASFHSSQWDHNTPIAGRRIGIIGTGSTSVQIISAIVDEARSVTLFQRTPQWILNVENRFFTEEAKAGFRENPARMQEIYDGLGESLNLKFAAALVGDNDDGYAEMARACRNHLETAVRDPDLRRRLTPDYKVGCKRLIVSSTFYEAIQRPNARLVDSGIGHIEATGVRTTDGELHEVDVLVFATGYDPFAFFRPTEILGRDGQRLSDAWEVSCRAHRSVTVPGFPNFFLIGGPNSPIGNFSYLMTAEVQIGYVMECLKLLQQGSFSEMEPTLGATAAFNTELANALPHTVWATGGCRSWYLDKSGTVVTWPWNYERFKSDLSAPRLEEFLVQ